MSWFGNRSRGQRTFHRQTLLKGCDVDPGTSVFKLQHHGNPILHLGRVADFRVFDFFAVKGHSAVGQEIKFPGFPIDRKNAEILFGTSEKKNPGGRVANPLVEIGKRPGKKIRNRGCGINQTLNLRVRGCPVNTLSLPTSVDEDRRTFGGYRALHIIAERRPRRRTRNWRT